MKALSVAVLLFIVVSQCFARISAPRKQLAGPPSEFASRELPTPLDSAMVEKSAFIWMNFKGSLSRSEGVEWSKEMNVDSSSLFAFSVYLPSDESFDFVLTDPAGNQVDLAAHAHKGYYPVGDEQLPCTTYLFTENVKTGVWLLSVSSKEGVSISETPEGAILMYTDSNLQIHSQLNTFSLKVGKQVGVVARITEDAEILTGVAPTAMRGSISGVMEVVMPNGEETEVQMHDDGLHSDGEPSDGVYGGHFTATEEGIYTTTAILKGMKADGTQFERSVQHVIPVVTNEIALTGLAYMTKETKQGKPMVDVHMEVTGPTGTLLRAYTQVWGKKEGEDVAVCWLSSLVDITQAGTKEVVLELNPQWVQLAGAQGPFTLKTVVLQDTRHYVPLSQLSHMEVKSSPEIEAHMALAAAPTEITREMRVGIAPASILKRNVTASGPTLLLSHGYCSEANPWEGAYAWDNAAFFSHPKSNVPNEEFAQELLEFAESKNMDAFSVIGHSQGGIAALHLLNYYWTPMDKAKSGRLVQTLGTPWKGCNGAGSAANLIKIFGYGCGTNQDLTPSGSDLWLCGIDELNRAEVHYYTTTYQQGKLFGDWCNLAVNLVLSYPNDGTSEYKLAQLPGGVNEGNKEKWCHTTDMGYPAQYTDVARNKIMNENAAR